MIIRSLNIRYRGFEIGYSEGLYCGKPGYLAAWRSSLEFKWIEGHMIVRSKEEIPQLARGCIDYNYVVESMEFELGRKLTISELPKPA